jgi:hypothetical protein
MGLKGTIQSLVGTAFSAIGDLQEAVDYVHEGIEPDYDVTTGLVTRDAATVTLSVRAVILSEETTPARLPTSLTALYRSGDLLALIPGVDMTISPTTGDRMTLNGNTWLVKGFDLDPAGGLWKVLITRLGGGVDESLVFTP